LKPKAKSRTKFCRRRRSEVIGKELSLSAEETRESMSLKILSISERFMAEPRRRKQDARFQVERKSESFDDNWFAEKTRLLEESAANLDKIVDEIIKAR
jgi:hypothetical protein